MATVTTTALIDDLDGKSKADVTVTFTVDGKQFRVDLSKVHYREWIAPLEKVGQPVAGNGRRPAKKAPAQKRATKPTALSKLSAKDQKALRSYLKRPRGRIADADVTAWKAAGKPS